MKVCTHIDDPQRMNEFGNPLTFSLAPPAGRHLWILSEMSQQLLDGLPCCHASVSI